MPFCKTQTIRLSPKCNFSKAIFNLIHADMWVPFSVCSLKGERYFLMIVGNYSRFTWLHLIDSKSEAGYFIKRFHAFICTQFGVMIKVVRTENGSKFNTNEFFYGKGIIRKKSCVNTSQQNAIVERKHQHSLNVARARPSDFKLTFPLNFGGSALCMRYSSSINFPHRLLTG